MEQKIIEVSDVTLFIKGILENTTILQNIWIRGEISNFKYHSSGHLYFTLKDSRSTIKVVMFSSRAKTLRFVPKDGMTILARGNITVYEAGGNYQLLVQEMLPNGLGEMYLALEALKNKLMEEGLFDESRKKNLPFMPKRIGVITSSSGAAIKDIISVINRRSHGVEIILSPAVVQGEAAPASIVNAINLLEEAPLFVDILIIGRGGGSDEDLWAFNDERVVRKIAQLKIPVISAIGHQIDYTLCDFIADVRAATPSAAAEIAVPDDKDLKYDLNQLQIRINNYIERTLNYYYELINNYNLVLKKNSPEKIINEKAQRIDELNETLLRSISVVVDKNKLKLINILEKLEAYNPLMVLTRGYSICEDENGRVIRSIKTVDIGSLFNIRMIDGILHCSLKGRENKNG